MGLLRYWLFLALGTFLAANLVPGIDYGGNLQVLALVVIVLSLLNLVVKPLLILFTLPFIVLTLGLGIWLVNAIVLWLTARIVDDFHVAGIGAALLGSLVISLTHILAKSLFGDGKGKSRRYKGRKDNVIDI